MFNELDRRFSRLSWLLFPFMLLTGILALFAKGFRIDQLTDLYFWSTSYGVILKVKLLVFAVVLLFSAMHDFYLGPKAVKALNKQTTNMPSPVFVVQLSRWAGRATLFLGLIIVFLAVSLVR